MSQSAANEILRNFLLPVFTRDGLIEEDELRYIEHLALRDGVVDSRERAVLSRLFDRADPDQLDPEVREAIQRFRDEHEIP